MTDHKIQVNEPDLPDHHTPPPEDPMENPELQAHLAEQKAAQMQVRQFIGATALGIYARLVVRLLEKNKPEDITHADLQQAGTQAYRLAPYLAEAMGTCVVNVRATGGPLDAGFEFDDPESAAQNDPSRLGLD